MNYIVSSKQNSTSTSSAQRTASQDKNDRKKTTDTKFGCLFLCLCPAFSLANQPTSKKTRDKKDVAIPHNPIILNYKPQNPNINLQSIFYSQNKNFAFHALVHKIQRKLNCLKVLMTIFTVLTGLTLIGGLCLLGFMIIGHTVLISAVFSYTLSIVPFTFFMIAWLICEKKYFRPLDYGVSKALDYIKDGLLKIDPDPKRLLVQQTALLTMRKQNNYLAFMLEQLIGYYQREFYYNLTPDDCDLAQEVKGPFELIIEKETFFQKTLKDFLQNKIRKAPGKK